MDKTTLFDVSLIESANAKEVIQEVWQILSERGYKPINQIVGYLMSGDPGFISSYRGARDKILSIDRAELLACIVKEFVK